MTSGNLIGRDAVRHALSRNGKTIRPGQPKGAAPVGLIAVLVGASLNDREIGFVSGERSQALGELVIRACLFQAGKPGFLGDSKAAAQENHTLGRFGHTSFRRVTLPAKSQRFHGWQSDQGTCTTKKMAAIETFFHCKFSLSRLSKWAHYFCVGPFGVMILASNLPKRSPNLSWPRRDADFQLSPNVPIVEATRRPFNATVYSARWTGDQDFSEKLASRSFVKVVAIVFGDHAVLLWSSVIQVLVRRGR